MGKKNRKIGKIPQQPRKQKLPDPPIVKNNR